MADILADYREWRDQQAARVSTHSGGCHMWHKDCMIHRLADALERARLTDAEREAVERLCEAVAEYSDIDRKENGCHADDDMAAVAVARGLLKRMV